MLVRAADYCINARKDGANDADAKKWVSDLIGGARGGEVDPSDGDVSTLINKLAATRADDEEPVNDEEPDETKNYVSSTRKVVLQKSI